MNSFLKSWLFFIFTVFPVSLFPHPHLWIDCQLNFLFNKTELYAVLINWEFDDIYSQSIILDYDKNHNKKFENKEVEKIYKNAFEATKHFHYFTFFSIQPENSPNFYILPEVISKDDHQQYVFNKLNFPEQLKILENGFRFDKKHKNYILNSNMNLEKKTELYQIFEFVRYLQVKDFKACITDKNRLFYQFKIFLYLKITDQLQHLRISQTDPSYFIAFQFTDPNYQAVQGSEFIDFTLYYEKNKKHKMFGTIYPTDVIITFKKKT